MSTNNWTVAGIVKEFEDFEKEIFLPDSEALEAWYYIRFNVFMKVTNLLSVYGISHSRKNCVSIKDRFINFCDKYLLWFFKNPFLFVLKKNKYLFIGAARRKLIDGYYQDIYTDPITLDLLKGKTITFEKKYDGKHLKPVKTKNLAYMEKVFFFEKIMVWEKANKIPEDVIQKLKSIEREINKRFNLDIPVFKIGIKRYSSFNKRKKIFKKILNLLKPPLLFIVCSYGKEYIIRAAKELKIPIVELQHGVITKYHMGYVFPKELPKKSFPDYFFSFGDFWNNTVDFPINKQKIITVGYPFLEENIKNIIKEKNRNQIIFISQGIIGKKLSKIAVDFADQNKNLKVLYKLHPGEKNNWEEKYPWLKESEIKGNINVSNIFDEDLYILLSESAIQVGVNSTALFEGLRFSCKTFIVDLPGAEYMNDLIKTGRALLIQSFKEISVNYSESIPVDNSLFFSNNWKKNFILSTNKILLENKY